MVIDCESCAVRFSACGECVVGVLLGMPPGAPTVSLDAPERHATMLEQRVAHVLDLRGITREVAERQEVGREPRAGVDRGRE